MNKLSVVENDFSSFTQYTRLTSMCYTSVCLSLYHKSKRCRSSSLLTQKRFLYSLAVLRIWDYVWQLFSFIFNNSSILGQICKLFYYYMPIYCYNVVITYNTGYSSMHESCGSYITYNAW